jgi:hypothetical protein
MDNLIGTTVRPSEDSVVEVDGKIKLKCRSFTEALKEGLELKQKFPDMQVKVYDACPS